MVGYFLSQSIIHSQQTIIMRNILFILLLTLGTLAHAERGQELQQFYTPNTYAFARYGDLPVDYSTGLPQINLPLTSISDRDIKVDVSLSYYASGIKVDQEASWVGLGWSLNAGGMITCQLRGAPDEMDAKTGKMRRVNLRFQNYPSETMDQYIKAEKSNWVSAADLRPNSFDPAPDIFFFNFCGRTGKFYLDENGKGRMINQDDCIIEFQPDGTFKITDEKGVVYLFKDKEYAYYGAIKDNCTSGWYLSSITSPAGGSITFTYVSGGTLGTSVIHRIDDSCYMTLNKDLNTHEIPPSYLRPAIVDNSNEGITGLVVSRITASSGAHIDFTCSSENRKDAHSIRGSMLDSITSYNSANDIYKKYKLFYGYFEPDERHKIAASYYQYLNYRLRLEKVQELPSTGTSALPPYRFSYYGDGGSKTDNIYALPYRLSPCQDHWGYYNYTDNKTIFANNAANEPFYIDPWFRELSNSYELAGIKGYKISNGGNREMDTEAVKACTLKRIMYPTGGYTDFDFETHDVNYTLGKIGIGGLRVKKITDNDENGNQKIRNYEYPYYSWGDSKYHLVENLYHVWYHQMLDSNTNLGRCRDYLAGYGVPTDLIDSPDILQITSFPALTLGVEGDFMYPNVTEYISGQGRTEYTYTYETNHEPYIRPGDGVSAPDWFRSSYIYINSGGVIPSTILGLTATSYTFPFMTDVDLGWMRGQLEKREVYGEDGWLMEADYMTYEECLLGVEAGGKAVQFNEYEFLFARDYLTTGRSRLAQETHEVYGDKGGALRTTKEYTYAPDYHKLVSEVKETASDGSGIVTKYYYPHDYTSTANAALQTMKDKHILLPVDVRSYKGGRLVSGEQTKYNAYGQPETAYRAETTAAEIAFNGNTPFTFTPYLWRTYDANRLLVSEETRENGLKYTYLWSYGNQYPVARIEGADYSDVTGWLSSASVGLPNTLTRPSDIESRLSSIRNALASKDVLVTTYTYLPQVGMTGMTDANGKTTGYVYDDYRRLSLVKNHESKAVMQYKYNLYD